MMSFKKLLPRIILCLFFIFAIACEEGKSSDTHNIVGAKFLSTDKRMLAEVSLEIAATESQRTLGLMYRNELKPNHGMIFIFPRSEPQSFWMKNTKIPLDIIFLDEEFQVVAIRENAEPYTTTPRDSKGKSAKYVVELAGGATSALGVTEGAYLEMEEALPLPS